MLNSFVLFLRKGRYPFTHPGWFTLGKSGTPTQMLEELPLNLKILNGELDVKRIIITKHREKEIIIHVL